MKNVAILAALLSGAMATGAAAEGISFGADAALGFWTNANGGPGLASNEGIDVIDTRTTGRLSLSLANDFGGFVGQVDLFFQSLEPAKVDADTDDASNHMADITLRAMHAYDGGARAGLFLGYGIQDDYGDSNKEMTYGFIGIDGNKDTSFGQIFGQVGYLDSHDEYDEGLYNTVFVRVGADHDFGAGLTGFGALSLASGLANEYDATLLGLELGLEKTLSDTMSVYGSVEYLRMAEESGSKNYGDTVATAWLGVKWNLDGKSSRAKALPKFGNWVSFYANEIE